MEQPRPGLQAGTLDDLLERGAEVAVPPAGLANSRAAEPFVDDEDRVFRGQLERIFERRPKQRKQRDDPRFFAGVMGRLWAWHANGLTLPVDVGPGNGKHFAWAPQASVPRQRDDRPPILVRASVEHPLGLIDRYKATAVWHRRLDLDVLERIVSDGLVSHGRAEDGLRELEPLADGHRRQAGRDHVQPVFVGIPSRDPGELAIRPEKIDQALLALAPNLFRRRLHVHAAGDVPLNERGQRQRQLARPRNQ
ncbi:MAG TPA: hypothetical protein VGG64_17430 [Pirellulales bacterium]